MEIQLITFRRSNPSEDTRFSLFYIRPERHCGPPELLCNGCRGSFVEVKRLGLGVNRPPILSSKVLTGWSIYSRSVSSRHGIQRNLTVLAAFVASRSLLASPCPSACMIAARTGQMSVKFFTEQCNENLSRKSNSFKPLNTELNPICQLYK